MFSFLKNAVTITLATLFALVFAVGFAIGGGASAYRVGSILADYLHARHSIEPPAPLLPYRDLVAWTGFTIVFGGIGLALLFSLPHALLVQMPRERRLKKAHPDEPWLHKPEWAAGVLPSGLGRRAGLLWFAAVYCCLVSLPTVLLLPVGLKQPDRLCAIWTALYVVGGLTLLTLAVRSTSRARRFGASRLELDANPAPIGRHFRARLILVGDVTALDKIDVTLKCQQRLTTGSGDNTNSSTKTLWEQPVTLQSPPAAFGQTEVALPLDFPIPAGCRPTDESDTRDQVTWHLHANASIPGVDLKMKFEVPVFRTQDSPPPDSAEKTEPTGPPISDTPELERLQRGIDHDGSGQLEIPNTTSWGERASILILLIISLACTFGYAIAVSTRTDTDLFILFMGAVCGVTSLVLLWALIASAGSRRTSVGPDSIKVEYRIGPIRREQTIPFDSIQDVFFSQTASMGTRKWFRIVAKYNRGREITIGEGIPSEGAARSLAHQVQRHIEKHTQPQSCPV